MLASSDPVGMGTAEEMIPHFYCENYSSFYGASRNSTDTGVTGTTFAKILFSKGH